MHYMVSLAHQAYRKIGDSGRRGFIQAYQKFGLKDLKWMGSFAKKVINSEKEKDTSIKGMMTLHLTRILLETLLNLHVFLYT